MTNALIHILSHVALNNKRWTNDSQDHLQGDSSIKGSDTLSEVHLSASA